MAGEYRRNKEKTTRTGKNYGKNTPAEKSAEPKKTGSKKASDPNSIRLNRYVANSGVCSRREADIYIAAGNIKVNGKTITEMGHKVKLTDEVKFDGRLLNPEKREYVLLNKPKDFTTSTRNERGKRTVSGLISNASKATLLPVDRLDKNTMGLLLFTNDKVLTEGLGNPKNGLRKIYHIELSKELKSSDLKKIQEGLIIDEKKVRIQDISYVDNAPKNQVGIEIYSTRNNIVRSLFEELEYEIVKLDRVIYAGLTKKDLPRGHWRYLTPQEVINLGMIK